MKSEKLVAAEGTTALGGEMNTILIRTQLAIYVGRDLPIVGKILTNIGRGRHRHQEVSENV